MASVRFVVGYLILLSICFHPETVLASSSGAPAASCVSMKPEHGMPASSQSPFDIILSQEEMNSDEILTLTLESTTRLFKGFLIMGFDTATDTVVGKFKIEKNHTLAQTLKCYGISDSAATHKSSSGKKNVTIQWIPPEGFNGTVVFKNTFVESESVYWYNKSLKAVKINRVEPVVTTTDMQSSPSGSSTKAPSEVPDIYSGCESDTKGCDGSPSGCMNSKSCSMVITSRIFDDNLVEIEILGQIKVDQYVAIGFSADREMGLDSVVECVNYQGTLGAFQSFNQGKSNQRLDPQLPGFSLSYSAYTDGSIYCKVLHPIIYTIEQVNFNLSEPYYVLLAFGPSGQHFIEHHTSAESSSSTVILTEDFGDFDFKKPSRVLKQLHGSFMIIAWMMAASIGILFPSYMKKTWVGKQIFGKDRWFIFHQGLMLVAWTLTVIGFILILIDVGGWVSEPFSINPHPVVGCITTVLAFIQPFMAALRPPPGSPTRYVFNWAHSVVGNTAHVLAITTIFLAVEMEEAELPYDTYWILTAHASCYLLSHLFLNFWKKKVAHMPAGEVKDASDIPRDEKGLAGRIAVLCTFSIISIGLGTVVIAYTAGAAS